MSEVLQHFKTVLSGRVQITLPWFVCVLVQDWKGGAQCLSEVLAAESYSIDSLRNSLFAVCFRHPQVHPLT